MFSVIYQDDLDEERNVGNDGNINFALSVDQASNNEGFEPSKSVKKHKV